MMQQVLFGEVSDWTTEEILITVRATPEPSKGYGETSCVAGVTKSGKPIRLFPIEARTLEMLINLRSGVSSRQA